MQRNHILRMYRRSTVSHREDLLVPSYERHCKHTYQSIVLYNMPTTTIIHHSYIFHALENHICDCNGLPLVSTSGLFRKIHSVKCISVWLQPETLTYISRHRQPAPSHRTCAMPFTLQNKIVSTSINLVCGIEAIGCMAVNNEQQSYLGGGHQHTYTRDRERALDKLIGIISGGSESNGRTLVMLCKFHTRSDATQHIYETIAKALLAPSHTRNSNIHKNGP